MADWTGNTNSVFKNLAASNHCKEERQNEDYYATDPIAIEKLCDVHNFHKQIWEPACGEGHLSKVLEARGYDVSSTDIIYRGYGEPESYNFLTSDESDLHEDIITNPPYKYALEFVKKALEIISDGYEVAFLLKIQFLEGKKRQQFFLKNPPKEVHVFSERIECAKNGEFTGGSAVCYAWFIWEKGWFGQPEIRWL